MTKFKTLLSTTAALALSACGGSGDGSATSPTTQPPVVLSEFADGSGVARVETREDGADYVGNVMAANIADASVDDDVVADLSDLVFVGSNQYGDFFAGAVTVDGLPIDVIGYIDTSDQALILYGEDSTENVLLTLGEKAQNIPTTGSFTYQGTNVIGTRDGAFFEDGTFAMSVNFGNGTASISGSTDTSTIGGTGITVNISDGSFSSSNLILTDTFDDVSFPATLHGNFHGSGATAVTGIYYNNDPNPFVAGAIAGTR